MRRFVDHVIVRSQHKYSLLKLRVCSYTLCVKALERATEEYWILQGLIHVTELIVWFRLLWALDLNVDNGDLYLHHFQTRYNTTYKILFQLLIIISGFENIHLSRNPWIYVNELP